jgi:phenylalanyl-tRNA synthetase beta chain
LLACGARPINNVVDVTNYVLLESGQPLHAFDFSKLAGETILVRRARAGELITTLDGASRTLSAEMLVIADAKNPVAVAGVMGATGSEVARGTTAVLLESALFDPVTVRRTARALGLASESSYRFERGVDPVGVASASARAAELIAQVAGGREVAVCDVGAKPSARTRIALDVRRAERWLGTSLSPVAARTTLARLSCHVASSSAGAVLQVSVPPFRRDLREDVDLFEELARVIGYERIPARRPSVSAAGERPDAPAPYERAQSLRCLCASLGLTEAVTWALVSEEELARFGYGPAQAARLANPLSQDHARLRPSLIPGLVQAIRRNLTQGALGARLFELGSVVAPMPNGRGGVEERVQLGMALAGVWSRDWGSTARADFFRLKGLLEALAGRLCEGAWQLVQGEEPWTEPGQGATLLLGGHRAGWIGQIARRITQALDLDEAVWVAEVSVEALARSRRRSVRVTTPSVFPPVKRDLSVVVGADTPFELFAQAIREVAAPWASRIELVDRYTGPQVPAGKASLTVSLDYRDPSRTLTAAEVDAVHRRVGEALAHRFGATLR